ncbi:GNAT family N-acetyltransferase [Aeromonas bestiarum]|uniref:GNAT family N-acetyltransferase n=1 Tax=Aeromonas bestiarum TaxID=105751 RepID=UPI003D6D0FC7
MGLQTPYPKQGVGRMLMNRIHEEARLLGIDVLTSHVSKAAESFFLRFGFRVVERGFPIRRGVTLQNALMRKDL